MPKTTFADHPVHPMLIELPLGLLPFSLMMDLLHLVTRKKSFADAAYYSLIGGYLGACASGLAGGADYFTIPPNQPAKKVANMHATLNIAGMGLYSLNLLMRRCRERRSSLLTTVMSMVGVTGLLISGWFGGHMVYEYGVRVKGITPTDRTGELNLPGSQRVKEWMYELEDRYAPQEGALV